MILWKSQKKKKEIPYPKHVDITFKSAHFSQMKVTVRVKQCWESMSLPKDMTLFCSRHPIKVVHSQCVGKLWCQPVAVQMAGRWAVWWIAYIRWRLDQWRRVDWLAQRGRGGKHFLCVLMDGLAEALWLLVAGWWLLLPPFLSLTQLSPSSFAFTLTVNQRRVNWDEPGFQSRKAAF